MKLQLTIFRPQKESNTVNDKTLQPDDEILTEWATEVHRVSLISWTYGTNGYLESYSYTLVGVLCCIYMLLWLWSISSITLMHPWHWLGSSMILYASWFDAEDSTKTLVTPLKHGPRYISQAILRLCEYWTQWWLGIAINNGNRQNMSNMLMYLSKYDFYCRLEWLFVFGTNWSVSLDL